MHKKIISFTAVMLIIITVFTGCDVLTFNSAENLVRPPKLSGDDGELQSAFESAVAEDGEYILRYPTSGDHRSAFVRFDCDGDESDEAFVFYSLRSEEMSVNMYFLDYENGKWIPKETTPGEGNDIHSVEFTDLNDDGISEILVGWSSLDSKSNKKLSVYCSGKDKSEMDYKMLVIESYTNMFTVDLDDDGEKEILLAYINSTSDTYTTVARLLKMSSQGNDYQITAVGQTSLYSEMTAVNSISAGWSMGKKYVYVDESAGDTYLTEILFWDNEKNNISTAFPVDVLSVSTCPTSRSVPLNCKDIDKDGEIEIPVTTLMKNSSIVRKTIPADSLSHIENIYVVSWKKYNGGDYSIVESYISNPDNGFNFRYDEEVMADWSVMFYPDDGITQFFIPKESDNKNAENETSLLFTIKAVPVSEPVSVGTYLTTGKDFKYTCEITKEGEKAGLTRSVIVSYFLPQGV